MTLQRPIFASFNGGELSPRMMGRVDTAVYAVGLETCENFVPTVEGPLVKRPGFEYIRDAAPTASWLSTFRFSLTQDYVLEWSDTKLRFFTNGARIETAPNVAYEVTVPYSAAQAPFVSQQQSYDRRYMDHPSFPPAALLRTSGTTFTYAVSDLLNGPFADGNTDTNVTVTASGATGAGITITASSAIFLAGHVGSLMRIEAKDFSTIPQWEVGIDGVAVGNKKRNEGKVYQAATAGRTGSSPPIHTEGSEFDGMQTGNDVNGKGPFGVQWTYVHDRFGIVRITGFTNATTVTADVVRRLPDSLTTVASWRWAHSIFSNAAGWPSIVVHWLGRQCHFKDFDLVASVNGDFGGGRVNFATFTDMGTPAADLSFRRRIAAEDPPLWAIADRDMLVGTATRELAVGPINVALAVSGDNIQARPQTFYGSSRCWPLQLGGGAFFVQRGGRKLRAATYDFGKDRYVAENRTVFARHIAGTGIGNTGFKQLCFQAEPEELLFSTRVDGQMIVHPDQPEQEIKGFGRIVTGGGGKVLSAVTMASQDGARDELWALIQRGSAKSIERMAEWREDGDDQRLAFFVDGGVRGLAAIGQTSFGPFPHLVNQPLAILADGGVIEGVVADATGSFAIPEASIPAGRAYIIAFGIPYTATATLLRPELKLNGETSQGKKQRIVKAALRLLETLAISVGGKGGTLDNLIDRQSSDYQDAPIPLFTGDSERSVSGNWGTTGQMTFTSSAPLPATIVAAMPVVSVEPPK